VGPSPEMGWGIFLIWGGFNDQVQKAQHDAA